MDTKTILNDATARMQKTVDFLEESLANIRAGKASVNVLNGVFVDYYGSQTKLTDMAAVSVSDPKTLTITPYDRSTLKAMVKAIQASDIGINPSIDGRVIRLVFPALTEERRKQISKEFSKYAEDAKVGVRNIRRDCIDKIKAMKKNSEITEDDQKFAEEKIQKITDEFIKEIDTVSDKKEKEIMEIFRELANQGKCVILVSHSPDVADMCDERYELTKISGKNKKR